MKTLLWAAALTIALAPNTARAEEGWPKRAVTYVSAFAPGSNTDTLGRIVANKLGPALGVPVVVENKPGAAGMIGSTYVSRAEPDGYTLLGASIATHSINQSLYPKMDYDSATSFEPITIIGANPNVLVVPANSPYKTLADIIEAAKKDPNAISYASTGVGTTQHLSGELLKRLTGVQMNHVPYARSQPIIDVISGVVPMMFEGPAVMTHVRGGKVRAIAVTSAKRLESLPDIPTVAETVPGYEVIAWQAAFAPAGTPKPIMDRLYKEFSAILKQPDVVDLLRKSNVEPSGITPDEFRTFQQAEIVKWRDLVKANDIRLD